MKKLLFILFITSLCSCGEQKTAFVVKDKNCESVVNLQLADSIILEATVNLSTWKIDSNKIGLVCWGRTEGFVEVFSYPDGKKLYEAGRIGQGPGEFITVNTGGSNTNELVLYDIMSRKLRHFVMKNDSLEQTESLSLYNGEDGLCKPFTNITLLDENTYLMKIDNPQESLWEIADLKKQQVFDTYINPIRENTMSSYTPFDFIQSVADTILLAAYCYIDRLEFYSVKENKIKPMYLLGNAINQAAMKDFDELMYYYISVVSHNNLFYCLRSSEGMEVGNLIEVYDLQGNCRKTYHLDREVTSITMDDEGRILGYFPSENETIIYRFKD